MAQGPLGRGKSPSPPHSASLKRESSIREARRRARERVRLRVRNMTNEQFKDYAARIAIDDILVDYLYYLFMIKKERRGSLGNVIVRTLVTGAEKAENFARPLCAPSSALPRLREFCSCPSITYQTTIQTRE